MSSTINFQIFNSALFTSLYAHHLSTILFFFNDTATTEIYTLSLHDALPISIIWIIATGTEILQGAGTDRNSPWLSARLDRKSTRLNSSHTVISYAVFCLKKKKKRYEVDCA